MSEPSTEATVIEREKGLREWVAVFEGDRKDPAELAVGLPAADVTIHPMTLEDVFVELVDKKESGE